MKTKWLQSMVVACAVLLVTPQSAGQKTVKAFPEIPPSALPVAKIAYNDGQDPMGSRLFRTTEPRVQINLCAGPLSSQRDVP
ncbi:MAG TPA: hypothetical protein VGL91_14310 [Acidobacteriota bacterium]|jgi:hypothetical protein